MGKSRATKAVASIRFIVDPPPPPPLKPTKAMKAARKRVLARLSRRLKAGAIPRQKPGKCLWCGKAHRGTCRRMRAEQLSEERAARLLARTRPRSGKPAVPQMYMRELLHAFEEQCEVVESWKGNKLVATFVRTHLPELPLVQIMDERDDKDLDPPEMLAPVIEDGKPVPHVSMEFYCNGNRLVV